MDIFVNMRILPNQWNNQMDNLVSYFKTQMTPSQWRIGENTAMEILVTPGPISNGRSVMELLRLYGKILFEGI